MVFHKIKFFFILIVLFAGLISTYQYKMGESEYQPEYISPPAALAYFTFGFKPQMADTLWLRALQDFSYCNRPLSESLCQGRSWLFNMLNVATDLDPKFQIVYSIGALALSVIISDITGASALFDKGVAIYPDDWKLAYRAAYHAIYEENDKPKAAKLLRMAGEHGAPAWVFSLAGRLSADSGNIEMAENILNELIATEKDPQVIERLRNKIASIKKHQQ